MHCASCAATIEKALKKLPGVTGAVVNLAAEKATIEWDEKKTALVKMAEAVKNVGYELVVKTIPDRRYDSDPGSEESGLRAIALSPS